MSFEVDIGFCPSGYTPGARQVQWLRYSKHGQGQAAALRTDQPLAPIEHGRFGAVPSSHLAGVGLDLMPAPRDQAELSRG